MQTPQQTVKIIPQGRLDELFQDTYTRAKAL
jgi:hypothetical protein